jgi:hypothetical protein
MPDDRTLSLTTVTATIRVPVEKVDIADWPFHLPDAEYQRCAQAHLAAGTTTTDDGGAMSINVETIGDAFVVQHYVAEVGEPHFCRMISISDSISPARRTKLAGVWELSVKPTVDDSRSRAPATPGSRNRTPTVRKKRRTLPSAFERRALIRH